jgi:dipeptidyl aminopeptidase/acylaminoacyl peptidase
MRYRPAICIVIAAAIGCVGESQQIDVPFYSIEQFYENSEYFGASFSADNTRLLVGSNLSGIYNAYAVPVGGGAPQALTQSTTDAVFPVSWFPGDDRFLYSSDKGGNELAHLHVQSPGGEVRDLTPCEQCQANFVDWAHDQGSFFVATNERDPRFFDVYEYRADTYDRAQVYENTEGLNVAAISRDKRHLALTRIHTTSNTDILLLDRESGRRTNITEHTGDVANSPAAFTPDGTALLYTTDEGREFAALVRYDLASGQKSTVLAPDWDVLGASFTHSGRYLVVTINEEAKLQTRVYDAATLQEVTLRGLPAGLVRGMEIARNDSVYTFYATDGSTPDELWAGRLDGEPQRIASGLSATMPREHLVAPRHVRFASYDGLEIPGLLYTPHQASPDQKLPALVLVHGGPGGQATVGYFALTQALVNHGYVVFDINNRGSSGYGKSFFRMDDQKHGEADLGDVVASKRMLIETGYVDSTRIGIIGGSYGGYMVLAALTLQPDAFKAGVDLFGISNWIRTLNNIPPWWEAFREALYREMGNPATDSVRLHRISPLFNASNIRAPLMVLQGANDPRVLQVESDEIVAAARANGVPVEYIVFPDEGHGFVKKENEIRGYGDVLRFLDRYLKGIDAESR